jgi:tRNA (guanine-N7-)-methyltransferase
LIQTPFIDQLARVLRFGGVVKLGTDWQNYAEQMLQLMDARADFENLSHTSPAAVSGFVARPEHRPLTRFERRGHRLGHGVWDLAHKKK